VAPNLRNKPVDKRYLSSEDRQAYRGAARSRAASRTRQRQGQMNQIRNRPQRTVTSKPGTGGFVKGIALQQQRVREKGQELQRAKQLRPPIDQSMYDIYQ